MGYRVLGTRDEVYKGYGPRRGLEGPFPFPNGQVLYYDPREGRYWDPRSDFYLSHDEVAGLQNDLIRAMRHGG